LSIRFSLFDSETVWNNQAMGSITFETPPFKIHDLRRIASTLLHEKGFASDVIEKALNPLNHEIKGLRGVYNDAE